jgi:hypothetical protein
MIDLETLEFLAEHGKSYAEEKIKEFHEKFLENPSHHLEWAGNLFEQAAKLEVYGRVLQLKGQRPVPDDEVVQHFSDFARDAAIRGARWPSRSTSPLANLSDQAKTSAWANLYAEINHML